ncbi:MAG: anti-sigma factor antagonist [Frankiaceae bacterium]|jgi:anti-sigma B factor antagonist|nr:anti-sigma factor antagonist [Frankiaceae bacterium]
MCPDEAGYAAAVRDLPLPDSRFDVTVLPHGPDCLVRARGDIDVHAAPTFRLALEEAGRSGACRVIVDLAAVGFMDSTGFGQLVWLVNSGDGAIVLVAANCRPIVRNALRLMGLDRVLTVHAYGDPPLHPGITDTSVS